MKNPQRNKAHIRGRSKLAINTGPPELLAAQLVFMEILMSLEVKFPRNHVDPSISSGTSPTGPVRFTISEFADMLGFPAAALNAIITKNRAAIKKPFYNISQLADRWGCSRAQVYNVLRETEFKVLNVASKDNKKRDCWRIPASVVERIEQTRMERLPEVAA